MKLKTKRFFAIIATLAMILSLVPMSALAEDEAKYATISFTAGELNFYELEVFEADDAVQFDYELEDDGISSNPIDIPGSRTNMISTSEEIEVKFLDAEGDVVGTYVIDLEVEYDEEEVLISDPVDPVDPLLDYSTAASRITDVDPDDPDAGEAAMIEVQFRTRDREVIRDQEVTLYAQSSRDAEELYVTNYEYDDLDEVKDEGYEAVANYNDTVDVWEVTYETDGSGYLYLWVTSGVPGNVDLKVGKDTDDGDVTRTIVNSPAEFTFGETDADSISMGPDKPNVNAGTKYKVTAYVYDDKDNPIEDLEVTFYESTREDRRYSEVGTDETNIDGKAEIELRKTSTGDYFYRAEAGDVDDYMDVDFQKVTVIGGDPFVINADDDKLFVEYDEEAEVTFTMEDRYGNDVKPDGNLIEVDITDPDGDDLKLDDDDFEIDTSHDEDFVVKFDADKYGIYTVEAFIEGTGISAVTEVEVADFGDVVEIEIDADETALRERSDGPGISTIRALIDNPDEPRGDDDEWVFEDPGPGQSAVEQFVTKLDATLIDENGIEKDADLDDISYSLSFRGLASLYESDDKWLIAGDDVSGVVTVSVLHEDSGLEDSVDISIGKGPVAVEAEADVDELEAEVTLSLLDPDGNKTAYWDIDGDPGYRVLTPAGVDYSDEEDFEPGSSTAEFMLEADEDGIYTVRVITDLGLSTTFDVEFGEVEVIDKGAEEVIMEIGNTTMVVDGLDVTMDVAPFIEDGRTFVPVRFFAEAFAAEADWGPKDALTEWVTLTREDLQVTMWIGGDEMQVVQNGEEETIELEAAEVPQIKDGRTFLPFRCIAETFGAEVDYETNEEGFVTKVWFTQ